MFSGPANVDDPYKTRVSLEFWPLGRLALTKKCLQTHGPVQAPSPSTIAHALFLERVRTKLIQHVEPCSLVGALCRGLGPVD